MAHVPLPDGIPGMRALLAFRYVDGLAAWTPTYPEVYRQRARLTAEHGYAAGLPR